MIGLANSRGAPSKVWREEVNIFLGTKPATQKKSVKKAQKKAEHGQESNKRKKREDAYAFASGVARSDACDRSAMEGQDKSIFLPYSNYMYFYGEYAFVRKSQGHHAHAKFTTFKRAVSQLMKDMLREHGLVLKLNTGAGHFEKCDICHNADQLLQNTSHWSKSEKNIIYAYRRRHIAQQFAERIKLRQNIDSTYDMGDDGQPLTALLFSDGMTVVKGDTPRLGKEAAKGDTHHITSRIIGVEVHCGPIHGTLLYYTDNMTQGGANIIIEVTRQAIEDLQKLLANRLTPLDLPQHLILQFDNCSENKNKYVFTYISLLIQEKYFKKVEVYFLIVGHTHASIDQYFSVLSREISKTNFIGSPISLESLLAREGIASNMTGDAWSKERNANDRVKPLVIRKIAVVYKMKDELLPLLNRRIHYYSIPHCFSFELYHGVCAMQYSLFSSHRNMLPRRPDVIPDLESVDSLDIAFKNFSLVGGEASFLEECGGSANNCGERGILQRTKFVNVQSIIVGIGKELALLEKEIIKSMVLNDSHIDLLDKTKRTRERLKEREELMVTDIARQYVKSNSEDQGLIMWLKPGAVRRINPEPIHLKEVVNYLINDCHYDSTGYDVCEIYELDLNLKYERVLRAVECMRNPPRAVPNLRYEKLSLDMKYLKYMKSIHNIPDMSQEDLKEWKSSAALKEIIATASSVFTDIVSQKITLTGDDEYEYGSFKLTRAELIFYYERLTVRGICLSLLAEFEKELSSVGYSLIRLVRPSEQDPERALALKEGHERHLSQFDHFVSNLLTKTAHNVEEGAQLISHEGNSLRSNLSVSRSRAAVDNFTGGQSNSQVATIPDGDVTIEMLLNIPRLTIARLIEIGKDEGVDLTKFKKGSMKKDDYIAAFVKHREELANVSTRAHGVDEDGESLTSVQAGKRQRTLSS